MYIFDTYFKKDNFNHWTIYDKLIPIEVSVIRDFNACTLRSKQLQVRHHQISSQPNNWQCVHAVIHWYAGVLIPLFLHFDSDEFLREPIKLEKQMIPHLKALIHGYLNFEEQACSFIRGCHATFQVKSVLFGKEVAWQPSMKLHNPSP